MTVHPRLSVSPSVPKATSNLSRIVVSKVTPCSEQKPSAKERQIYIYVFSLFTLADDKIPFFDFLCHFVCFLPAIVIMTRMTIKPFESFTSFSTRLILLCVKALTCTTLKSYFTWTNKTCKSLKATHVVWEPVDLLLQSPGTLKIQVMSSKILNRLFSKNKITDDIHTLQFTHFAITEILAKTIKYTTSTCQ